MTFRLREKPPTTVLNIPRRATPISAPRRVDGAQSGKTAGSIVVRTQARWTRALFGFALGMLACALPNRDLAAAESNPHESSRPDWQNRGPIRDSRDGLEWHGPVPPLQRPPAQKQAKPKWVHVESKQVPAAPNRLPARRPKEQLIPDVQQKLSLATIPKIGSAEVLPAAYEVLLVDSREDAATKEGHPSPGPSITPPIIKVAPPQIHEAPPARTALRMNREPLKPAEDKFDWELESFLADAPDAKEAVPDQAPVVQPRETDATEPADALANNRSGIAADGSVAEEREQGETNANPADHTNSDSSVSDTDRSHEEVHDEDAEWKEWNSILLPDEVDGGNGAAPDPSRDGPVPIPHPIAAPAPADEDAESTTNTDAAVKGDERIYNERNCSEELKKCQDAWAQMRRTPIDSISLDITPPYTVDEEGKESAATQRDEELKGTTVRTWRTTQGEILGEGRLYDFRNGRVFIEMADGQTRSLPFYELSEDDSCYVTAWWRLPNECRLEGDAYVPRQWTPTTFTWTASSLCHKTLYFEDVALERYGHTLGPIRQPILSGAHFFSRLVFLPYQAAIHPWNECQYALGYYRPGSCAPWMIPPIPLSWRGALAEASVVVGVTNIFP